MRIVYACDELPPYAIAGGIGTYVRRMANEMAHRGHEVYVVGLYRDAVAQSEMFTFVPVRPIDQIRFSRKLGYRAWRWRVDQFLINRDIWRLKPDVVEWPDYLGWATGRNLQNGVTRLHASRLVHLRSGFGDPPLSDVRRERRVLLRSRHWNAPSRFIASLSADVVGREVPKQLAIFGNPVDRPCQSPRCTPQERVLMCAGSLSKTKGTDLALVAACQMLETDGLAQMHFYGRELSLTWDDLLNTVPIHLRSRFFYHGYQPWSVVRTAMADAWLYIMPSRFESFGNGWAEAQSLGTPVLALNSSAAPEVIKHGESGWLCQPEAISEEASRFYERILEPRTWLTFSETARGHARQFHIDRVGDLAEAQYRRIAAR